MIDSYFGGEIPDGNDPTQAGRLPELVPDVAARYDAAMVQLALTPALAALWEIVGEANKYLVEREPWAVAKDESRRDELAAVLYAAAETLRALAVMILPIMPAAATSLWEQLGMGDSLEAQRLPDAGKWGQLPPGAKIRRGAALFPRVETESEE